MTEPAAEAPAPAAPIAEAPKDTGPITFVEPSETKVGVAPTLASALPIPRKGILTVVVVTTKGDSMGSQWNSVSLTGKDWAVMDVVEIHSAPESTLPVYVFTNDDNPVGASAGKSITLRKVADKPTLWLVS